MIFNVKYQSTKAQGKMGGWMGGCVVLTFAKFSQRKFPVSMERNINDFICNLILVLNSSINVQHLVHTVINIRRLSSN